MKTELVPVLALVVAAINAGAGKAQESTTDGLCAITCDEEEAEAACGSPLAYVTPSVDTVYNLTTKAVCSL